MNNIIECICRLLPNKIHITIPSIDKETLWNVVGIICLDTDLPMVVCKKNSDATYNVPCKLIDKIIVSDFGNEESKDKVCRN
jgi:hypothetical protein